MIRKIILIQLSGGSCILSALKARLWWFGANLAILHYLCRFSWDLKVMYNKRKVILYSNMQYKHGCGRMNFQKSLAAVYLVCHVTVSNLEATPKSNIITTYFRGEVCAPPSCNVFSIFCTCGYVVVQSEYD